MTVSADECLRSPALVTVTLGWGTGSTLALPGDPGLNPAAATWWNDLSLPDWSLRYTYAPPSRWVPGGVLLAATADQGAVPLGVALRAPTLALLEARKEALRAALAQWPGTLTITATADGESATVIGGPWARFPAVPQWGEVNVNELGFRVTTGTVSIPVNPTGAP